MEIVPTVPNLALKAFKKKFYIHNQKELKLTKNPDCSPFSKNKKKYKAMLHLVVAFQ